MVILRRRGERGGGSGQLEGVREVVTRRSVSLLEHLAHGRNAGDPGRTLVERGGREVVASDDKGFASGSGSGEQMKAGSD